MDTKKISRAFLGLCFITFLISCEDSDVVSYPEYDLSYEMDTTRFLNTGEERTISLKFVRRKAIDNIKTDIWEKVPSSTISISSLNDSFRTQFYPEEQTIKVSIGENRTDEVQTGSLLITINEDQFNQTIAVPLRQDAAQIIYDYKIISEQNPFIIPKTDDELGRKLTYTDYEYDETGLLTKETIRDPETSEVLRYSEYRNENGLNMEIMVYTSLPTEKKLIELRRITKYYDQNGNLLQLISEELASFSSQSSFSESYEYI